jgi:hypothetical protein
MRKIAHSAEEEALAGAAMYGGGQYPYRCALCGLWHRTSPGTADEMPGDVALGERLRAAGFSRTADPVQDRLRSVP